MSGAKQMGLSASEKELLFAVFQDLDSDSLDAMMQTDPGQVMEMLITASDEIAWSRKNYLQLEAERPEAERELRGRHEKA